MRIGYCNSGRTYTKPRGSIGERTSSGSIFLWYS